MIKQQLDQDLKAALLSGDKDRAMTLRGLKSVILYAEVAEGKREEGLTDEQILSLFSKEAKKRQESADLFAKGGNVESATKELAEKKLIEGYLPAQMSDNELRAIVDGVIGGIEQPTPQMMGQIIGQVKQNVKGMADGSRIAMMVKERLTKE